MGEREGERDRSPISGGLCTHSAQGFPLDLSFNKVRRSLQNKLVDQQNKYIFVYRIQFHTIGVPTTSYYKQNILSGTFRSFPNLTATELNRPKK